MSVRTAWRVFAAAALAVVVLAVPTQAHARTWTTGSGAGAFVGHDFVRTGPVIGAGEPRVEIERAILWEYKRPGTLLFEPFSVDPLANGNVLIADRYNVSIIEVNRRGEIVWSYGKRDDARLINPYSAQRLANGNTLILDRRADLALEVTPGKSVVWEYGAEKDTLDPGSLVDPYSATRLANGNTLIADNRGGTRVLEIRTSDYDPADPALGYDASSIVWRYGRDNEPGTSEGLLASPRKATRLPSGNTLIVDAADQVNSGNRVVEISPAGRVVWAFEGGEQDVPISPSDALRLADGTTLVVEEDGDVVYRISRQGDVLDSYATQEIYGDGSASAKLRSVRRTGQGTLVIADQGNERVFEVGFPRTGTVLSPTLDLGLPGARKTVQRVTVGVQTPAETHVVVEYSLDGGRFRRVGSGGRLPTGSTAVNLRYRVTLKTDDQSVTPSLHSVNVAYEITPPKDTSGVDGKGGGDDGPAGGRTGSGSPNGSGAGGPSVSAGGSSAGASSTKSTAGAGSSEFGPVAESSPPRALGGARFTRGTVLQRTGGAGGALAGLGAASDGVSERNAMALALMFIGSWYLVGSSVQLAVRAAPTGAQGAGMTIGRR